MLNQSGVSYFGPLALNYFLWFSWNWNIISWKKKKRTEHISWLINLQVITDGDFCFLVIFDHLYFFWYICCVIFFKRQNLSLNREREGCKVNVKI